MKDEVEKLLLDLKIRENTLVLYMEQHKENRLFQHARDCQIKIEVIKEVIESVSKIL